MGTLILNFILHNLNLKMLIECVEVWIFTMTINHNKTALVQGICNKKVIFLMAVPLCIKASPPPRFSLMAVGIFSFDLVLFFFLHLIRDSHQVRTVINVERAMVFRLQCSYPPSSRQDPGCCLQGAVGQVTCCLKPCKSMARV